MRGATAKMRRVAARIAARLFSASSYVVVASPCSSDVEHDPSTTTSARNSRNALATATLDNASVSGSTYPPGTKIFAPLWQLLRIQ